MQDADELVFVPHADALSAQQKRIVERYAPEDVGWYVNDPQHADMLVQQYLDDLNDGKVHLPVEVM